MFVALRPCCLTACLIVTIACLAASPAKAQEGLVVDLSERVVAITTGFIGSSLLLFGAVDGPGDIVVVVRGPREDTVVRRKERTAGIWMNRAQMEFPQAPTFYAVASSRPLEEFASDEVRHRIQLGVDYLDLPTSDAGATPEEAVEFRKALIRGKQAQGLYQVTPGSISFVGGRLFRTQIWFPSNVAVGAYGVDVYQFRDGNVASVRTVLVNIRKTGAEAEVYEFAHERGLAYGVLAVLVAVVAGWLANLMFRRT